MTDMETRALVRKGDTAVRIQCIFGWGCGDDEPGVIVNATGCTEDYALSAAKVVAERHANKECTRCAHGLGLSAAFRIPNDTDFPSPMEGCFPNGKRIVILTAFGPLNPW